MVKNLPAMQETGVQYLDKEDNFGEGNGNPLQYSCLKNSMDRGAWWSIVHGVVKSRTWLELITLTFTLNNKTTGCHLTPFSIVSIKKSENNKCCWEEKNVEKLEPMHTVVYRKMLRAVQKNSMRRPQMVKNWPTVWSTLGIIYYTTATHK